MSARGHVMTPDGSLTVGYAAMLEQFDPRESVELTAFAEEHGFSGCMAADHFQPWVPQQGQACVRLERVGRCGRARPRATSARA